MLYNIIGYITQLTEVDLEAFSENNSKGLYTLLYNVMYSEAFWENSSE